jgi:BirA family biotin operon repressor/biotin-[acetyl-CoA-carboxylase] ligase
MTDNGFFNILDTVDSTNNYAMGRIADGTAGHGMLWFTNDQTAGKGQRGKTWTSEKGKNIAMSLVLEPGKLFFTNPFHLSAIVAITCFEFFSAYAGAETKIKWPNDLFWRDRKAGGILIENNYKGTSWKWAVAGIGLNINQTRFDRFLIPAVSLKEITGKDFDTIEMAKELYNRLMEKMTDPLTRDPVKIIEQYNILLYRINKTVALKKDGAIFETVIKGVSSQGRLITVDAIEREFDFGEVEWIL